MLVTVTETDSSGRPDSPRRWGDIALRTAAGVLLLALATAWFMEASDHYRLAASTAKTRTSFSLMRWLMVGPASTATRTYLQAC
jgi:hypothetical protein